MIGNDYKFGNEIYDNAAKMIESLNNNIIPDKLDIWKEKTKLHTSGRLKVENPEDDLFFGMHLYPENKTGEISIFTKSEKSLESFTKVMNDSFSINLNKLEIKPSFSEILK